MNITGGSQGQIQSLDADGDGNYEPELNCQWIVAGTPGKVLQLTFTQFNVEREANQTTISCWDYVEVRDGSSPFSPLIGHFCGTQAPDAIISSSRYLWIKFFSDSTTNQRGFLATLQNVDPVCGSLLPINVTETPQVT